MKKDILDSLLLNENDREEICKSINKKVIKLCFNYPIYSEPY